MLGHDSLFFLLQLTTPRVHTPPVPVTPLRTARHLRPLARALASRGLDVAALAAACGVKPRTVDAWDTGRRSLPTRHAEAIASMVGAEQARAVYVALHHDGRPGAGRLPVPGSPRSRLAHRATLAELRRAGRHDLAADVAAALEA